MDSNMATAKSVISTIGSVAAATMVARTIINDFLPEEIHGYLFSTVRSFFSRWFSSQITLIIREFDGLVNNEIFEAAEVFLGSLTKSSPTISSSAHRLRVTKPESEKSVQVAVDQDEEIVDEFEGAKFTWVLHCSHVEGSRRGRNGRDMYYSTGHELRAYHLRFHKKYKDLALDEYLSHVLDRATSLKQENKTIKLYTVDFGNLYGAPTDAWTSITFNHPATFETLAMDSELKKMIVDDLDMFVERKDYYRRVGKAWKRGYLLYGPPGTGKSSLIAAMANYLNFDVYDLELGVVECDSDLRKILVGTGNRSIIIVEDIDCCVDFKDREAKNGGGNTSRDDDDDDDNRRHVTLSGLLNFIDGLWSSCGDERMVIFTTNHKDKLDPALLRPGRMDMHIHMSYCTLSAFKTLARNYLGVKNHELFGEIEGLIDEARVTPAEVAEQLIKYHEADVAMRGLVDFLRVKIAGNEQVKGGADGRIVVDDSSVQGEGVGESVKKVQEEENASLQ